MAKRKAAKTRTDVGGPTLDLKPDPRYREFLEEFLGSGVMGAEFPCRDGNRFQITAALRTVVLQLSLPVMIMQQATRVLVMRTTPVAPTEPAA